MEDHLVEADLGRVVVPEVLVVGDELGADGEPQLDDVGLPVEVDEADEAERRAEEGHDDDQQRVARHEAAVPERGLLLIWGSSLQSSPKQQKI